MNKPYQLQKNAEGNELFIHGDITSYTWYEDDVCAFDLAKDLKECSGDITVRINSYGGEVAQGLAIYNLLKDYDGKVTTKCDGFACSAASVIFMAGQERVMPKSSLLMIHNAWSWASGDSNALKKAAEDLEKMTQPSIEIYKANSNLSEEAIKEMMDNETWITAEEALEYGFITSIVEDGAKQSLDNHYLSKMIFKTKELESKINELESNQKIEDSIIEDAWASFFNGKK